MVLVAQGCKRRSCLATLLDTEAPLESKEGKECPSKITLVKKVESSNPRDGKLHFMAKFPFKCTHAGNWNQLFNKVEDAYNS